MFSMGLTLTIEDFKRVSKFPKAFFAGTILQVVVLPAIAFGLAMSWQSMADVEQQLNGAYKTERLIVDEHNA